jgi:glycosyltransferase involved in cell wall biosynthesis
LTAEPLVSVVIPVFNGDRHLDACMSSVVGQSYEHIEVIVSDQASTDRSVEIVRSFADSRVRLLPDDVAEPSLHTNWARSLAAAQGDLVKIVCQDDLLLPDCLSVQVELLDRYRTAVLTCGRRRIIDNQGKVLIAARGLRHLVGSGQTRVVNASVLARACTRAGTNLLGEPAGVLIRRSALPAPLFDPRWRYTIDVDFYFRCLKRGEAVLDDRVLSCFRVGPQQLSAVLARSQAGEFRAFLSEMAHRYPRDVSHADVRVGTARALLLARARRMLYFQMKLRDAVARRCDPDSPSPERSAPSVSEVHREQS